ncbi:MAG: O-antigen ligase family protein [Bacteroidia bacterium]
MIKENASIFKFDINALTGLMILSLPASVKFFFASLNTEVIYPAEILIGILAVFFFYNLIFKKQNSFLSDKSFLKHPLTILVFIYLAVNILSAFFSTMHLVSLKALIVKCCYVLVFYFMMQPLIKSSINSFAEIFKIYGLSLSLVVVYALIDHFQIGLSRGNSNFASYPFFNDHTIYGAALAFLIPAFLSFSFYAKVFEINRSKLIPIVFVTLLFIIGLYFSFCRAAWISIIAALILFLLVITGMRFRGFIFLLIALLLAGFFSRHLIVESFKKNKIDSNIDKAGLYEQVFSLTNITNDLSNVERLNRWSCAMRMFRDKPFLGFGPGTYQFKYLSYQRKEEMTFISMKEPLKAGGNTYSWSLSKGLRVPSDYSAIQGNGGSAHSEYFLALSETGIFSFLIFVSFFVVSLYIILKIFSKSPDKKIKVIAMFALLGLTTYYVHALFNNFLDDGKLAFLFWCSLSAIAALDKISSQISVEETKVF